METIDELKKQNKLLLDKVIEQNTLIENMRDVLRFCARDGVGTYYQQESAKSMLLHNKKLVYDGFNENGTYNEKSKKWMYDFAENRNPGSGQKALEQNEEIERELLGY